MSDFIQRMNKNKLSVGLLILIILSWALYPWAVSWIFPKLVRLAFAIGLVIVITLLCFDRGISKQKTLDGWEKLFFILWVSYLVCCVAATFIFNDSNSGLFFRYFLKSLYFLILFFYINKKTIFLSFDIYANLAVALVVLSIASVVGFYFGWLDVQVISVKPALGSLMDVNFVFSGFDGNVRLLAETPIFIRMQSFAIEPGAFALAILPALYWFVLVRKQFVRATVIVLGVSASWSLGALPAMILALFVIYKNIMVKKFDKQFLLLGILFFILSHAVFTIVLNEGGFNQRIVNQSIVNQSIVNQSIVNQSIVNQDVGRPGLGVNMISGERGHSFNQRWHELIKAKKYVEGHLFGAGIGGGTDALKSSISVGYANVFADTGVLGGSFYMLAFLLLGYKAAKGALGKLGSTLDVKVASSIVALGVSVLTCLFFGLQREQPDNSYWSMWIYASFFSLYGIARKESLAAQ